ncbi:sensor histidine kinase [Actinomadura scrupuli]|uniref:sensor histidine kinase n=1 Tax=Actinomadura scrupuli TaxID=559629 RepID=UPI003D95DFAB
MPRPDRSSLRMRITLVAGAFAALVCIVISVLVVMAVRDRDARSGQAQVTETIDRLIYHIKTNRFPHSLVSNGDDAIQVLDTRGRVVTATPQLLGKPPMADFQPTGTEMRAERTMCPPNGVGGGCMTVVGFRVFQPNGIWMIYTAIPTVPWYADGTLAISLAAMAVLITVMMSVGVFRAVGRTLTPVEAIRIEMDEITATGLDRRVPVPRNQKEIRMLAESVNTTLDRLEAAYEQLRRFTADASHEVRSPLTAMRAQVEEALMYPDDTDWPEVGEAVLAAVERLQTLVIDLLLLARLDAGVSLTCDVTDLGGLVEAELDRRTSTMKIVRDVEKNVFAQCDRLRVARLLANLLDNAERHALTQIMVTVRGDGPSAILEVADDGAGIPAELREEVFKRFTRLDTSRTRDSGGSGLGLAIARQIAEVHGGTLTIEDSERGARFVLRLRRTGPPPAPSPLGTEDSVRAD